MKAYLRNVRISPKKANLIAGTVREKKVSEALALLKFMPKKGADILYKVVHSAASNAKNNFKQSMDELYITSILVTKGPTVKRSLPISRGRVHPIRKRSSHITVEVGLPGAQAMGMSAKGKELVKAETEMTEMTDQEAKVAKEHASKKTTSKKETAEISSAKKTTKKKVTK